MIHGYDATLTPTSVGGDNDRANPKAYTKVVRYGPTVAIALRIDKKSH